ncbi:MAG: DUF1592 domain-containing protein [Pirellulales bacterium]
MGLVRPTCIATTLLGLAAWLLSSLATTVADDKQPQRVSDGLIALYDFSDGDGKTIRDRSGVGAPLDLEIEDAGRVRWSDGALAVESPTLISSSGPAKKIVGAIKKSNAITIEAWVTLANATQGGPARIVSLSANASERNFTLGQEKEVFDVRLRATGSDNNGIPSTSSPRKSLQARRMHVAFTREPSGAAKIYVDGKQVVERKVPGGFGNWDGKHRLLLANEATKDRAWLGTYHLVAVYDRALSADEVRRNFAAGVSSGSMGRAPDKATAGNVLFETKIAPLFARHCLECHDSALAKGGLDLSRKDAALAGGESGKVFEGGKAAGVLWDAIAADEMPKDRPPLSTDEKAAIRSWLEAGAAWPLDRIDPANYLHAGHAGDVWVQRLTVAEYVETVRSAVGVDIAKETRELLPADLRADGFSNTAYNLGVDLKHIEAYGRLAEIVVGRMDAGKFAGRFSKQRSLDADKLADLVAAMGKWLLRGPLDAEEVNVYRGIASTVIGAGGDYDEAVRYIVEAMLQSPRFVYRMEDQRGDGSPRRANQYELASRMSYILWGGPPDEALFRAADRGELGDREKVAAQVRRMLDDPRTIERSRQFVSEWLNLGRLANLRPDARRFPEWNAELAADMREETLAFFTEVVWKQKRPLADLLDAQLTFATPRLAEHYGLKPAGDALVRYDLSDVGGRGGILTHGSVLTIGGDNASMVSRGLFVLHELLRGTVNAPPPCVNTTPPPTKAGLSHRGIAEARVANVNCGVCHVRFEPLAYGLEKFDGVGAYHERDAHGNQLRDDGEVLFPGDAKAIQYKSSAELMKLLADSPRVRESLTWKVTQFALGRPLSAVDAPIVAEIHKIAEKNGGTYANLITAIVMSDLVQKKRTEKNG